MWTQQLHSNAEQNNPSRDCPEGAVSARFHKNPAAFCLQWEHNWPSNWNKSPSYILPGNSHKKIARNYGQRGLVPLCIAVFACSTQRSAPRSHGFTHNSINSASTSGECIHLPQSWGGISSPCLQQSYRRLILLLLFVNIVFVVMAMPYNTTHEAVTFGYKESPARLLWPALLWCSMNTKWSKGIVDSEQMICFWTKQNSAGVKAA